MPNPSKLVNVGSTAPDFTLASVVGPDVSVSEDQGKRCVVLVFLRGFR